MTPMRTFLPVTLELRLDAIGADAATPSERTEAGADLAADDRGDLRTDAGGDADDVGAGERRRRAGRSPLTRAMRTPRARIAASSSALPRAVDVGADRAVGLDAEDRQRLRMARARGRPASESAATAARWYKRSSAPTLTSWPARDAFKARRRASARVETLDSDLGA